MGRGPVVPCRLGLDAGTGELRGLLFRHSDGRVIVARRTGYPIRVDGAAREVDHAALDDALDDLLDAIDAARPPRTVVERIGVAGTASTVAVVTPDGTPLSPAMLWADHRATDEAAALRAAGHPNLRRMLGHVSPEWGIAKLLFLGRTTSLLDRADARVVEAVDWLGHRLTGRWLASAGIREWGWAGGDSGRVPERLITSAGGDRELAGRVIGRSAVSGTVLGPAEGTFARRHPWLAAATVHVGGMDSHLTALGMGVAERGRVAISVGSSSAFVAGLATGDATGHLFGPMRRILPGDPDGYWQGGQTTAGLALDWVARIMDRSRGWLERAAAAVPVGSDGVVFRETMLDRRTPDPRAPMRGRWSGLGLEHGPGHLYRSVLEGVALGIAEALEPLEPSTLVAVGGMTRSPLFVQVLADVMGRSVGQLWSTGTAALGAAFADEADRIPALNPVVRSVEPSGADYSTARERHRALAADPP